MKKSYGTTRNDLNQPSGTVENANQWTMEGPHNRAIPKTPKWYPSKDIVEATVVHKLEELGRFNYESNIVTEAQKLHKDLIVTKVRRGSTLGAPIKYKEGCYIGEIVKESGREMR